MNQDKSQILYSTISTALSENPELLDVAISAITCGMQDALAKSNKMRSDHWAAMNAALTLADPKRLSADTKEWANKLLVEKVKAGDNGTAFEADVIKRIEDNR
jgi:hypothetical protein